MTREPIWKLAGFYFFYFALVGGISPYFPVYLEYVGFDALEVGQLMSILMLTRILAPNLWGWIADATGKRLLMIRMGSACATFFFAGLLLIQGFWWHALLMTLFSCFWNAVLPQFEVVTLHNLGDERARYSSVRLWGSIGFVVSVTSFGALFNLYSVALLPWLLLALLVGIFLSACIIRGDTGKVESAGFAGFLGLLRNRSILLFFFIACLGQISFGPFYTFFSIYLKSLGYDMTMIGLFWSVGVVAEILLFSAMHRLLGRYSLYVIVVSCLLLTALRWSGVALLAEHWWVLVLTQALHAASFGGLHAAAIEFVHRAFPKEYAGQGQAMYSAVSFGVGGAIGANVSGAIYDPLGATFTFLAAAGVCLLSAIILILKRRNLGPLWN
ncbi:MFS transporter [Hahella aquimaris]|uniref:MFS transporter n=1 Tax=Hahella sp. HNIBRBA332 TaxID=3015983 RepID=UPI00273C9F6C|nr:MFS transporter [Hahella sp. HNIBRBA332]WLQ15483.1 MFS transporter [Hahella sp. HNIBRBA332]